MKPPTTQASVATEGDEYEKFCGAVRRLCQVDLSQYKRGQMERRIRTHANRRGIDDLPALLAELKRSPEELDAFLDRVTINVSQLWRHPEQWTALADHVLPDLAEAGSIRAWSAGCSIGAEAYTLAAVCLDVVPRTRLEITGTDIDKRVVDRAREGRYTQHEAGDAPAEWLERHFDRVDDRWSPQQDLRGAVSFSTGDLLRMPVRKARYDLVMCRNTVIYFTEDVRDALHDRLAESLRIGGYLVVGASERVNDPADKGLESAHPFIYRRV